MTSSPERRLIGVVLFPGFELLDVFGPLEMFGVLTEDFGIVMIGPTVGDVASAQGPRIVTESSYVDAPAVDIVLVPGGIGTRTLVKDERFLEWLKAWATTAEFITSVCTGSGVLAAAGLLDGCRATSNKRSFSWASAQGREVAWIPEARWVEDGNRWTSSGVAAGIDMALALIAHLHGEDLASGVADRVEYQWHRDSSWDPYAAKNGLVVPREDGAVSGGGR
jgi:transcriptional regulator GlxA family with amidase domain